MLTRRSFLRTSAIALGAVGTAPTWLLRAAAQGKSGRKVLVAIFQRGAADGLNVVVPFFEPRYYQVRPSIALPQPGRPNGAIDLDGRFALHPALQPLKALWDSRQLAIVHAAGSPDASRSHFDAQDFMECGTPGIKRDDGWLNRALAPGAPDSSPVRAIASGAQLPKTLQGSRGAIAVDSLPRFQVADKSTADVLENLYSSSLDAQLKAQGKATFDAIKLIDSVRSRPYTPVAGAQYVGDFGQRLQQIARLIKADVGVEVAFADIGGWDHHSNENGQLTNQLRQFGSSLAAFTQDLGDRMEDVVIVTMSEFGRTVNENGQLTNQLRQFGSSLAAFTQDLGDRMEDVVIVTMSEFGRTVNENGNAGTDHGHGNVMMVVGGGVRGGRICGQWPGLEPEQLFERRDLAVTTDFRDVLGELVTGHLGQNVNQVFPGYTPGMSLGLLA
jgi:uncharacterized protein (DUF1501 family)